jgi:hypothetical protein
MWGQKDCLRHSHAHAFEALAAQIERIVNPPAAAATRATLKW